MTSTLNSELTDERIGELYLSVRHIGHATNRELAFARAIEAEVRKSAPNEPVQALPELPELPRPACTYADHSYPAFSKVQMQDYARAAIASLAQKDERNQSGQYAALRGDK